MAGPLVKPEYSITTDEDLVINGILVLEGVSDPDNNPAPITVSSATSDNGTVIIEDDGTLSYTPNENFNGEDVITYELIDGDGEISTSTIVVTVNSVNDEPEALPYFSVERPADSTTATIDVLALSDATDVDNDTLTITAVESVGGLGTVVINADNTISYTPNEGVTEGDVVSYTIEDGNGGTYSGYFTVNPEPAPEESPVVAVNDLITGVKADSDGGYFLGDLLDGENNALENDIVSEGWLSLEYVNGEKINQRVFVSDEGEVSFDRDVTVQGDNGGTFTIETDGRVAFWTNGDFDSLPEGESVSTSFTYTAQDENGNLSTATFTIVVDSALGPVQAFDDNTNIDDEYLASALSLFQNDVSGLNELSFNLDGMIGELTESGLFVMEGSNGGTFTLLSSSSEGLAIFSPGGHFDYLNGGETATTSMTYEVIGDNGEISSANWTVTITGVDDAPIDRSDYVTVTSGFSGFVAASGESSASALEDYDPDMANSGSTSLLNNTEHADGGALKIYQVNGIDFIDSIDVEGSNGGRFTVYKDGTVVIDTDPESGFFPAVDDGEVLNTSFSYSVIDDTGTATAWDSRFWLTIKSDDISEGVSTDQNSSITFTMNQIDAYSEFVPFNDQATVISLVTEDGVGYEGLVNAAVPGSNGGEFKVLFNGTITFDPKSDFDYLDEGEVADTSFTYAAEIEGDGTRSGEFTVQVVGVNDDPTLVSDSTTDVSSEEITYLDNILLNADDAEGHSLEVFSVGSSSSSASSVVQSSFDVIGNVQVAGNRGGTFTVNKDGEVSFDPGSDFDHVLADGTSTTYFYYRVVDEFGAVSLYQAKGVSIQGTNYRPEGVDDTFTVTAGANEVLGAVIDNGSFKLDFGILGNDIDANSDELIVTGVTNGSAIEYLDQADPVSISGTNGGVFTVYANGEISFDAAGFESLSAGENTTSGFTYILSDEHGAKTKAEVVVTIEGTSADDVTVADDVFSTDENTLLSELNVIVGSDESVNGTLSVSEVNGAVSGVGSQVAGSQGGLFTVNADGSTEFDPNGDFNFLTADSSLRTEVTYTVVDSNGTSATATVSVDVTGSNDDTVAQDDSYAVDAGSNSNLAYLLDMGIFGTLDLSVLGNDSDPEGETIYVSHVNGQELTGGTISLTGSNGGTFTILSDGTMSFDASEGFEYLVTGQTTTSSVNYTASDISGGFSTATITVTVNGVNDAIIAANDYYLTASEDAPLMTGTNVLFFNDWSYNDVMSVDQVNDDALNVGQSVAGDQGGLFTISTDGNLTFDSNGDFDHLADSEVATTSVSYTIISDIGEASSATVYVDVTGANDAAIAGDDTYTVDAGTESTLGYTMSLGIYGTLDFTLLANDKDVDGTSLSISSIDNGQGAVSLVGGSQTLAGSTGGVFTVSDNGVMSFDASGFESLSEGEIANTGFTYTVIDDSGAESQANVTVKVIGQNEAVEAFNDYLTTDQNTVITMGAYNVIQGNDNSSIYSQNELSIEEVNGVSTNVGQSISGSAGGLFIIEADGSLSFDANGSFDRLSDGESADTSVSYKVAGPSGDWSVATATVTVIGVNDDVIANDDNYRIDEGAVEELAGYLDLGFWGQLNLTLLLNDVDADRDPLSITSVNGQTLSGGDVTIAGSNGGLFTINGNGEMTFDATVGFDDLTEGQSRTSTISYAVSDGSGADTATVSVEVYGVDDPIV